MVVKAVTTIEEFTAAIGGPKPAVFDFWAIWCGPCRMISPVFEQLSEKYPQLEFYKVDVDEADDISHAVSIRAMPTFIAFKDGKQVEELVGADIAGLERLIEKAASL